MSANVSEETRRSPRSQQQNHPSKRIARSPSPRSVVQQHPSSLPVRLGDADTTELCTRIPPRFLDPYPSLESSAQQKPTDQLWWLLRQRDWDPAQYRLRTHPRDAAWLSPTDGSTPLHWACRLQCPFVAQIWRVWPVALWTPDAAGWLPLHVALMHGLGGIVVASSSSSEDGPEVEAMVELIRAGGAQAALAWVTPPHPEQALTVTGTALHLACRHGVSAMVLTELLLQCSNAGSNDNNDSTALQRLLQNPEPKFPADLIYQQFRKQRHGQERDSDTVHRELLQRWNLLMAAFQGCPLTGPTDARWIGMINDPHHQPPLFSLHQVLEFESACTTPPHSVIPVYLQFYPHTVTTVCHGRFPLHTACALARDEHCIETIYRAHPAAVRIRDATTGQLPIHIMLLWKHPHSLRAAHSSGAIILQTLARSHPLALETRCPVTRLFPYQLAALPRPDHTQDHDTHSINLIYSLLRACPQVVQYCY